jgi:hypothetical protein
VQMAEVEECRRSKCEKDENTFGVRVGERKKERKMLVW